MQYIKVKWIHTSSKQPIWLYSELDDDRWEIRKVYIFPDATIEYASLDRNVGSTMLGLEPVPLLGEIADDSEFLPEEISAEEFEKVWKKALNENDHTD